MRLLLTILFLVGLFFCKAQTEQNLEQLTPYRGEFDVVPQSKVVTYTVPSFGSDMAMTSAGVYRSSDSSLVRTLWVQTPKAAGSYNYTWDGNNDTGVAVPYDGYYYKVLYNDVKYTWQGVIGNTSDSMSGTTKHKGFQQMTAMCFSGSTAYYGIGYQESMSLTYRFDTSDIGQRTQILHVTGGITPSIIRNCTDGTYVYWAAEDVYTYPRCFVYATRTIDDSPVGFVNGYNYPFTYAYNNATYNTINFEADNRGVITDISVQKTGNFLFIARPNRVMVLNKTTGALVDSVLISGVTYLKVDATDGYLWATRNSDSTTRYIINNDGTLTPTGLTILSNQPVAAIDINPTNTKLAICEGGTNQIINFYNPVNGTFISSFGTVGGYLTNAIVSNSKFYWNDARATYSTFISFAPNGSFWVEDYGNGRVQHYDSNFNYINRIAWIPVFYNCAIDYGNTSRVFADMKEYSVDWTKTLDNGTNGSWTLVRNWGGDLKSTDYDANIGLHTPLTFSNGHTFCFFAHNGNANIQLIELNSDGTKRYTGKIYPWYEYLDKSQNLTAEFSASYIAWGYYPFTGYDVSNNPTWGSYTVLQSTPTLTPSDAPLQNGVNYRPNAVTDDSVWVNLAGGYNYGTGYHLEGVKHSNTWAFKSARATSTTYNGNFPTGERYDIGNTVRVGGSIALALGKTIIWGYNGEFWKQTETNMFSHVYSDGLVINQFGVSNGKPAGDRSTNCYPGDAGNSYSIQIFTVSGNTYLIHNDESMQGGIHVWKITGMNTITEQITGF